MYLTFNKMINILLKIGEISSVKFMPVRGDLILHIFSLVK
jgi:hypothetical protein